jgi:hypothetical protein
LGTDDGDQFLDRPADGLAELEQSIPFFWLGVDLPLHSRAKDLVLFLEGLDIFGELSISSGSDESQQWVDNLGHFGRLLFCNLERCFTFVVQG